MNKVQLKYGIKGGTIIKETLSLNDAPSKAQALAIMLGIGEYPLAHFTLAHNEPKKSIEDSNAFVEVESLKSQEILAKIELFAERHGCYTDGKRALFEAISENIDELRSILN